MEYIAGDAGLPQPRPAFIRFYPSLHNVKLALQSLKLGGKYVFESEMHGRRYVLFRFRRDDGSQIALRVLRDWPATVSPELIRSAVRREVYVLKKLQSIQFQYAPRCIAFDLNFTNAIGRPFLVVTWMPGQQLIWTKDHPAKDLRMRVLSQLLQIQLELVETSQESRTETAKQYYSRLIHDRMMAAPRGLPGTGGMPTQEDYWRQFTHLESILGRSHADKTYAIAHHNVIAENIIVDSDYNVECIVGWSHAGMVPLGQVAVMPRLLMSITFPSDPVEKHFAAITALEDKIKYWQLLVYNPATTPATEAILEWQTGEDAEFRALYMLSMKHSDVFAWLSKHGWQPPLSFDYRAVLRRVPPMSLPLGSTMPETATVSTGGVRVYDIGQSRNGVSSSCTSVDGTGPSQNEAEPSWDEPEVKPEVSE